jgi:aminotransferase
MVDGPDEGPASGEHALGDPRIAQRANLFPESVIREMTRVNDRHGAVNLGQGFPDFRPPERMVEAAHEALDGPRNQYATTWGTQDLREAACRKAERFHGLDRDPDDHATVTCGATEAMMATMLALVDPGDAVLTFDPFYENYGPDAVMSGADLRTVPLRPRDGRFRYDEERFKELAGDDVKALIVNTPHNPTGRVLEEEDLRFFRDLCVDHDIVAVTDEIYEHLLYDGREHVPVATLDGMLDRTVTITGASKTYSCTGWRVAWALAPVEMTTAIRRIHDFLTVGAPHPLQQGVAEALGFEDGYYEELREGYRDRRDRIVSVLDEAGFHPYEPEGAYYVMADFTDVDAPDEAKADSRAFAEWLVREGGVTGVPGGSFFDEEGLGEDLIRFHFAVTDEKLESAAKRLRALAR